MRSYKWLLLVLLVCLIIPQCTSNDSDEYSTETDGVAIESDLVELNREYVGPSSTGKNDTDDTDSDEENDEEEEEYDAKSAVSKALAKSRKSSRRAVKLLRRHRAEITVALILIAFRREIGQLMFHVFGTPEVDPSTGKVLRRVIKIQPTAILKILIFVDLMRRLQGSGSKSVPLAALLMGGSHGLLFRQVISALLLPSNPSYVPPIEQHYTFEKINERYDKDGMALKKALASSSTPLADPRHLFKMPKSMLKKSLGTGPASQFNGTVILMDLTQMDTSVSQMRELRDKVSFLLNQHRAKDTNPNPVPNLEAMPVGNLTQPNVTAEAGPELEIVILLESPGGAASEYGLAAQQILRLRDEPGIQVTVCVDTVAASGGYMMACTSSPGRLFAAPFAVVGSIGVIGQTLNVHNVLQNWGVRPLVFRGGKDKAPVGMIGEVTKEGIETVQTMIDKTHDAFKRHVLTARPIIAQKIEDVATGDVWLGCDAIDVGLIDRVVTSDEYIGQRLRDGARVLKLLNFDKPRFPFGVGKSRPYRVHDRFLGFISHSIPAWWTDLRTCASKLSQVLNEHVEASRTPGVADVHARATSMPGTAMR